MNNPVTEPKRSQKPKRPLFIEPSAHRYSFYGNAPIKLAWGMGLKFYSLDFTRGLFPARAIPTIGFQIKPSYENPLINLPPFLFPRYSGAIVALRFSCRCDRQCYWLLAHG